MIIKELASVHSKSQDQLFLLWIYNRIISCTSKSKKESMRIFFDTLQKTTGPYIHGNQQEEEFLSKRDDLENFFKKADPLLSNHVPKPKSFQDISTMRMFPAFMAEWNAYSRKIFQLGEVTQNLLERTDYAELNRSDLIIPFPNFIIRLAHTITLGNTEYTAVGFSENLLAQEVASNPNPSWSYVFLREDENYVPLSDGWKKKGINILEHHKKHLGFLFKVNMAMIPTLGSMPAVISILSSDGDLIPDFYKSGIREEKDLEILRKVHSMIINLIAVIGRSQKQREATNTANGSDREDIFFTENIFDVSTMSALGTMSKLTSDPSTRRLNDSAITPHWRRKHSRRHPGMGHIPDAPYDVIIPRTLVLGDFLKEGTLPRGSVSKL